MTNIEDPVFLFRLIFDIAEYNANPQLNYNVPHKNSITSSEQRQDFLDKITSEGISFTSRIVQVQTSCKLPENHISELKTTGITTIVCNGEHYCLPGSNITIKGIPGLNGVYKNGVSLMKYSNEKRDIPNRVDAIYDDEVKGSALGMLHTFQLIKESSHLENIEEGIFKGYLKNLSPNATVEVFHKVYRTMPYNEWLACVLTTMCYLYGPNQYVGITGYASDLYGTVVDDWMLLAVNSSYSINCFSSNAFRIEPMVIFVNNNFRYSSRSLQQEKISSLFNIPYINDPYHIVESCFNKYFLPYIKDDYNLVGTPDVYGPSSSINIIPILHYLQKGSVKNIYWGLSGSGVKTKEQNTVCRILNMFNVDEPSVLGGTRLVGKLFDWFNPYNYEEVKKGRENPNPQTWIILGGTNTEDGRDRKQYVLDYYCGMVKNDFTNGKRVGYIFLADFGFTKKIANGSANFFSDIESNDETIKAKNAIMSVLSPMMYYLVTQNQCESIILDIRGNNGGGYSTALSSFFGDNNNKTKFNSYLVKNDTGYSFPLQKNEDGTSTDIINNDNFKGCIFKGSPQNPKKVVLLNSYGTFNSFVCNFFGDKGDGYIGSNTYCSLVGNKNLGFVSKTYTNGINIPTESSKLKFTLNFSLCSGNIYIFSSNEGPLFNKPIYSDGFWNQIRGSAYIPDSLKSISGGTSIRNDMSLLYYSFGLISPPTDLFLKYIGYKNPVKDDPMTWKDPWVEQSIRESISDIMKIDISNIYPSFELDKKSSGTILNNTSFVIESGQQMYTTRYWDISLFNIQVNFIIDSGIVKYNPRGADDKGNSLVPFGNTSENVFIGFFNSKKNPQYGISISSELYTDGVYALGFFVGKVIKQYNTKITFPCSISILIQANSQLYFTVNGYHMYQGNTTDNTENNLMIGARLSNNLKDNPSTITIKDIVFQ